MVKLEIKLKLRVKLKLQKKLKVMVKRSHASQEWVLRWIRRTQEDDWC